MLIALAAAVLIGIVASAGPERVPLPEAPMVGIFTGEYVDGIPVYRLPAMNVVATREGALGATPRGSSSASGTRARASAPAGTPPPSG